MQLVSALVERLGYPPDSRLLIVSCDGLGSSHAANVGVYDALRIGLGSSAGLMVPCPWAREAASRYRGEDIGVQLTLNAEWETYRWAPITHAPSLLGGDGGFPSTLDDLWDHADLDEVRRECRAQIERAIFWGFDVSHLSTHMGALQFRPEFFDVALDLAVDFTLPLRLGGEADERSAGFPFRARATEEDILMPDHLVLGPLQGGRRILERTLFQLEPGVTELVLRPAADTPELRALTTSWAGQVEDHDALVGDRSLAALVERAGAALVGYRQLRSAMRAP